MRVLVIRNPASGSADDQASLDALADGLRAQQADVSIAETAGPGDGTRLAAKAAAGGADLVVAAGGDGTLNEVVNGLAEGDALSRTRLGLLPLGTGNDFARTVGIEDPTVAVQALVGGTERAIDLVAVGARVFLNASAGGLTAETSARVTGDLKRVAGKLAYLIGGAQAFFEYEPVATRVEADGRAFDLDVQLFAVCNGAYIGGGHQLAPTARPDDGLVEVCLVKAGSTLDFLTLLPRLSSGDHIDDEDVVYFRTTDVHLTFAREIAINTDGEVLQAREAHYHVRPGAVRFVLPATPAS